MKNLTLSRRYAEAFLDHARETIGYEHGLEELNNLKRVFIDNPDLKTFLESPQITQSEKSEMIDAVLRDEFSAEARNFLKLLLVKARISFLVDIAEYARIKYAHGKEVNALLKTSYPLATEQLQQIKDSLEERFKEKLHMYVELDSDLLGGIRVQIENTIIDGSVKRRLSDMREKLTAMKVS